MLTKKQKTLLDFIDGFIKGNGYSPTYREIMRALGYKSVSTVAKHIDNLVASDHLIKQDGAIRSLEVMNGNGPTAANDRPWWHELEREIARREGATDDAQQQEAEVLRQALEIVRPTDETASSKPLHTD